ncbi:MULTISPECIES: hypothetical protein [unclassified Legionella]|uniref:hypothetical protein n=1 Tax=unclassified Legionella TaxID=2622702 RepID=UPI0010544473|nr:MULTISPECIES: hypothetical protein [unclassified Legionella]MDI9818795.1 hypothetical protein [Legionella sp. PL877]
MAVSSRVIKAMQRMAVASGLVGGAYASYETFRQPYQPRIWDYMQATWAVGRGVTTPQPPPEKWQDENREMLDAIEPPPEVRGVNRALNEYGVGLNPTELALFVMQAEHGKYRQSRFSPGFDLASETLIAKSFGREKSEIMEQGKIAAEVGLDEEAMEPIRKQAAAAGVGHWAHTLYGAVKATFSYGAISEDTLGAGSYNSMAIDESMDEIEHRTQEIRERIAATKDIKGALQGMKAQTPSQEEEQRHISAPER